MKNEQDDFDNAGAMELDTAESIIVGLIILILFVATCWGAVNAFDLLRKVLA